ncbi:MAG: endonuclease/exonuclease/phosphatase family protein [Acidobacteriota bacterium]
MKTFASLSLTLSLLVVACAGSDSTEEAAVVDSPAVPIRVALFNIKELSTQALADASGEQLRAAAEIIGRIQPDILVLQEIDHDLSRPDDLAANARRFAEAFLGEQVSLPYAYAAPCNTGRLSGIDLDGDGQVATAEDVGTRQHGGDSYGFGTYPGQYSMAVLSRYPIAGDDARTFQNFPWRYLPGNHLPKDFYSAPAVERLRLSSKSHWDLPIEVGEKRLHLWISHPTPPAFDGDEDRNGRRNFDEIKLWVDYLEGVEALVDDQGRSGGFASAAPFVIVGDLNARPNEETSLYDGRTAISQLLDHRDIIDPVEHLVSSGARAHLAAYLREGGPKARPPSGPPGMATATFLGGSRVDYLLPRQNLGVIDGGVFWPSEEEDATGYRLAEEASDHRLVWLDLVMP